MLTRLLLRAAPETLLDLERGLEGYALGFVGPACKSCHLLLVDGRALLVSAADAVIVPSFECFTLAIEPAAPPATPVVPFRMGKRARVRVLLREEYTEPYRSDSSVQVGRNPVAQATARTGSVPEHATAHCLVASGVLVEEPERRLMVRAPPWPPLDVEVTDDDASIIAVLSVEEAVSLDRYLQQYCV